MNSQPDTNIDEQQYKEQLSNELLSSLLNEKKADRTFRFKPGRKPNALKPSDGAAPKSAIKK